MDRFVVRKARCPESPRRAGSAPRAYRQATLESLKAGHGHWVGGSGRGSTARPGLTGLGGGVHLAAPGPAALEPLRLSPALLCPRKGGEGTPSSLRHLGLGRALCMRDGGRNVWFNMVPVHRHLRGVEIILTGSREVKLGKALLHWKGFPNLRWVMYWLFSQGC